MDSNAYLRIAENTDIGELESVFEEYKADIPVVSGGSPTAYSLKSFKNCYFDTSDNGGFRNSRD